MLKGLKTFLYGAAVAIIPAVLEYAAGIDMKAFGLSPIISAAIGAGIVGLRAVTNSPPGLKRRR